MNAPEKHPMALELDHRIAESETDFIAATVVLLGQQPLMGEVRKLRDGLYCVTVNAKLGDTGEVGRVDICFTADKPSNIMFPSQYSQPSSSVIVSAAH